MDTEKDLKKHIKQEGNQGMKKEEKMGMRQDMIQEARSGEKDMKKGIVQNGRWQKGR